MLKKLTFARAALLLAALLLAGGALLARAAAEEVKLGPHTTAIAYQRDHRDADLQAWAERVPRTEVVEIASSRDGSRQPAVWYDSGARRPRPLLVALHSWSADYEQNLDIPFAEFAIANDWAFIHPDFRGPNRRPQATASDLAVQDVIDAVEYARARATIDDRRIYLVGYSGGAMKALVLAGRYPERWAGVASFGAIYDIADWYRHDHEPAEQEALYRQQIAASCGGPPRPGTRAEAECRRRSPLTYLAGAAGAVPVLLAHGLKDTTVPLRHSIDAYNVLAAPGDRFSSAQRRLLDRRRQLPRKASGWRTSASDPALGAAFTRAKAPVRLERRSRGATLVIYDGGHDLVYNAALHWLAQQRREGGARSARAE